VVPINGQSHVLKRVGECDPSKPPGSSLAELLAWDLRAGCRTVRRTVDVVEGYRVYYEWDNRVYNAVMARPPADTIPLKVNLR
jgi:hypothetical protein